jgi:hypothetical protein
MAANNYVNNAPPTRIHLYADGPADPPDMRQIKEEAQQIRVIVRQAK